MSIRNRNSKHNTRFACQDEVWKEESSNRIGECGERLGKWKPKRDKKGTENQLRAYPYSSTPAFCASSSEAPVQTRYVLDPTLDQEVTHAARGDKRMMTIAGAAFPCPPRAEAAVRTVRDARRRQREDRMTGAWMQTRVTSVECQRRRGTCHGHMTPQEEIRKDCTEVAVALLVRRDAGARGRGEAVDRGADGELRAAL